jgi:hypothetical protein
MWTNASDGQLVNVSPALDSRIVGPEQRDQPVPHVVEFTAPASTTVAMSTQSFGRSNSALNSTSSTGPQHSDLPSGERHVAAAAGRLRVQRRVVEEQVDRCVVPPQPDLSLPGDDVGGARRHRDARRQRRQHRPGLGGGDEGVHIDVPGTARVLRAVRQRDRSAEGMVHAGCCQALGQGQDLLDQRRHDGTRG